MRFLKHLVLASAVLASALCLLAVFSLRALPAPTGRGGGGGASRNGDVDCDGQLTINDPVRLLNFLFLGGEEPCALAQDGNGCCPEMLEKLERIARSLEDPCRDPLNRIAINGDGTVTDRCTGLMWQDTWLSADLDLDGAPDVRFNWNQATAAATADRRAGHSDWRLPTFEEMETLVHALSQKPYRFDILPEFRIQFRSSDGNYKYWTSTAVKDGEFFTVRLISGDFDFGSAGGDNSLFFALLVRGPVQ